LTEIDETHPNRHLELEAIPLTVLDHGPHLMCGGN
jgi:hypothetical protein